MRGAEGVVKVNGRDRSKDHRDKFFQLSCYIMQDDALRPSLTVKEAMTFVAHLRLGYLTSHKQKQKQVKRKQYKCKGFGAHLWDMLGMVSETGSVPIYR